MIKIIPTANAEFKLTSGIEIQLMEIIKILQTKSPSDYLLGAFIELAYKIQPFDIKLRIKNELSSLQNVLDNLQKSKITFSVNYQNITRIYNWIVQLSSSFNINADIQDNIDAYKIQNILGTTIEISAFYEAIEANWIQYCRIKKNNDQQDAPFLNSSIPISENSIKVSYTLICCMELLNSKRFIGEASMFKILGGLGGSVGKILDILGTNNKLILGFGMAILICIQDMLYIALYIAYDPLGEETKVPYGFSTFQAPNKTSAKAYQPYGGGIY